MKNCGLDKMFVVVEFRNIGDYGDDFRGFIEFSESCYVEERFVFYINKC